MAHWTNKYFGSLYHEIYRTHLLDPQRALDEAAFAAHVLDLGRRKVLDLACGYGRHARLLASSNKVYALDNNAEYVSVIRQEMPARLSHNLLPMRGDMRQLPLRDKSIDAAIILFNSFGYFDGGDEERLAEPPAVKSTGQIWKLPSVFYERQLVDPAFGRFRDPVAGDSVLEPRKADHLALSAGPAEESENLLVLKEVFRVLKPGGGMLLEVPNRRLLLEAVEENPRRLMVMNDAEVHEEFEWDARHNRLLNRTRFVSGDRTESGTYSLRLYEPAELKKMVLDIGFRIKRTYGDYSGSRFGVASSDVLLVHATRPARSRR